MSQKIATTEAQALRRKEVEEMNAGVPRLNIGALFLPPIWGCAHGLWVSIAFYPLWLVADTCFVNALAERTPLAVVLGIVVLVVLTAVTFAFAVLSQPYAFNRALSMGVSKETYLKRQKIWAVVSVLVGIGLLAAATYYNLVLNTRLAGLL